jgi:signal transduction histidine kinase
LNFNRLVQETAVLVRRTLQNEQIEIAEDMEPNLPWVEAHAGQIQQIVLNLIQNSRDAIRQIDGVGRVVLRTSIRQGWVTLQVEDNGPGIPEEIWSDIFEPFFTTKEGDQGTGVERMCWYCTRSRWSFAGGEERSGGLHDIGIAA